MEPAMLLDKTQRTTRAVARILLAIAAAAAIGACSTSVTEPGTLGRRSPASVAAHDDNPPLTECRSGWLEIDGRWICND
jgi:hypothetical protein